jgi:hypothetical protein
MVTLTLLKLLTQKDGERKIRMLILWKKPDTNLLIAGIDAHM